MRVPTYTDLHGPEAKRRDRTRWNRGTIYQILRNETYAGVWHYNKESEDDLIPVQVPAIVSRQLWKAAQK
jgi:hypothetical protein